MIAINVFNSSFLKPFPTSDEIAAGLNFPVMPKEDTLFTSLIDMIALEEGLFCESSGLRRWQRARNHILHGLELFDGSAFRYSSKFGPQIAPAQSLYFIVTVSKRSKSDGYKI